MFQSRQPAAVSGGYAGVAAIGSTDSRPLETEQRREKQQQAATVGYTCWQCEETAADEAPTSSR